MHNCRVVWTYFLISFVFLCPLFIEITVIYQFYCHHNCLGRSLLLYAYKVLFYVHSTKKLNNNKIIAPKPLVAVYVRDRMAAEDVCCHKHITSRHGGRVNECVRE